MSDLFICAAGRDRSPHAADVARELAHNAGYKDYFSDYWGMYNSDFEVPTKAKLEGFDRIFVMDERMSRDLQKNYSVPAEKIINLDVADTSAREKHFKDLLRKELTEKLTPYFPKSI